LNESSVESYECILSSLSPIPSNTTASNVNELLLYKNLYKSKCYEYEKANDELKETKVELKREKLKNKKVCKLLLPVIELSTGVIKSGKSLVELKKMVEIDSKEDGAPTEIKFSSSDILEVENADDLDYSTFSQQVASTVVVAGIKIETNSTLWEKHKMKKIRKFFIDRGWINEDVDDRGFRSKVKSSGRTKTVKQSNN
jgi:hypothetical protein